MADRLYRVYLHTDKDESIREVIVTADSKAQAESRALAHVKASNQGKGSRSKTTSAKLTKVLAVTPTSKKYCLVIHSIPAAVISNV